jgi:hypothetical protein
MPDRAIYCLEVLCMSMVIGQLIPLLQSLLFPRVKINLEEKRIETI